MFASYDNPSLVDVPKTKIKYYLKKIGLIDSFFIEDKQISQKIENDKNNNKEEFFANSFSLEISKVKNLEGKTAGVFFDNQKKLKIFTQEGTLIDNDEIKEIQLPIDFTIEKEGGVKNVIYFNNYFFALLSRKKLNCYYASLINSETQFEILKTECIPDEEKINFAGLGGGYTNMNNDLIFSIGTPTHYSEDIDKLAQNKESFFGKTYLMKNNNGKLEYSMYSEGHRNPQGITNLNGKIFSTEHGPEGGDELNIIKKDNNYGWPLVSFGNRYGGKSYKKKSDELVSPIYSFMPAIAPSSLNVCPKNLKSYYKDFTCLLGLTLKEMSVMIYLLDKNDILVSMEKIFIEKRLRHFGVDKSSKLFTKGDNFYFSADNDGLYKAKFNNFK